MKIEDRLEFGEIKDALLKVTFIPISQMSPHELGAQNYPQGALCAKMPKTFDAAGLIETIDMYSSGTNGAIVSTGPGTKAGETNQWVIMNSDIVEQVKSNLRIGRRQKFANQEEAKELSGRRTV